jgi:glycosyltransferase involved in cell wall biosynthesis
MIVCMTTPPFLGLGPALVARLGLVAHIQWTMDVFPDALWADRTPHLVRFVRPVLEWAARRMLRTAALVITLGPSMQARIVRYLGDPRRAVTVPLWSAPAPPVSLEGLRRVRAARSWRDSDVVLLYSGNMGRGHRFDDFLEAARRLGADGPIWAFLGGGPRRHEIERYRADQPDARIEVLEYVAAEDLPASLASADVHLVSMRSGWSGIIMPSKLQAAFAIGRPVLFVGPREDDMAKWIADSGAGWAVAENDVDALLDVVTQACDPAERARRGRAAIAYAQANFEGGRNCERLADLLLGIPIRREVAG